MTEEGEALPAANDAGGGAAADAKTPKPARGTRGEGGGATGSRAGRSQRATPPTMPYTGALAGWAASAPPPTSMGLGLGLGLGMMHTPPPMFNGGGGGGGGGGRGGASVPMHPSALRYAAHAMTTGKMDVGHVNKRRRVGSRHAPIPLDDNALKPCLFWRNGQCKNGDDCGYLHGDSPVRCQTFNTKAGCRFGDKCAFKHVRGPLVVDEVTDRDDVDGDADGNGGANPNPNPNPFATHASNCGCDSCHPPPPVKVRYVARGGGGRGDRGDDGSDSEDGEILEVVEDQGLEDGSHVVGERTLSAEEVAARDETLTKCSGAVSCGETTRHWAEFLSGGVGGAHKGRPSNGLVPFWKKDNERGN